MVCPKKKKKWSRQSLLRIVQRRDDLGVGAAVAVESSKDKGQRVAVCFVTINGLSAVKEAPLNASLVWQVVGDR